MNTRITIVVRKDVVLDEDLKEVGEPVLSVYMSTIESEAWIGEIKNKQELMELLSPDTFIDVLDSTLSQLESNYFLNLLSKVKCYYFGNQKFEL